MDDDKGGFLGELLQIMKVMPTTRYAVKRTGKDRRTVSRGIQNLVKKGLLKKTGNRGVYEMMTNAKVITLCHHKNTFFRIHNLSVEIIVHSMEHKIIQGRIMRNKQQYSVRPFGKVGHYFTLGVTGMISKKRLFLEFPSGWELECADPDDMRSLLYDVIKQTVSKWESRFKVLLVKEGRADLKISNMHIAYYHNGICHELKEKDIRTVYSYDKDDGKLRWGIDWSPGQFPEIELFKPDKAIEDSKEVKFWGDSVIDGRYRHLVESQAEIRLEVTEIRKALHAQAHIIKDNLEITHSIALSLKIFMEAVLPKPAQGGLEEGQLRPEYIG